MIPVAILTVIHLASSSKWYSFSIESGKTSVREGKLSNATVWGTFEDNTKKVRFSKMQIVTNGKQDLSAAYLMGYAEAFLSAEQIGYHRNNALSYAKKHFFEEGAEKKIMDLFSANLDYIKEMIKDHPDDKYWRAASLFVELNRGLADAYNSLSSEIDDVTEAEMWYFQNIDIAPCLNDLFTEKTEQEMANLIQRLSGTIIAKLKSNYKELYVGQNTFDHFGSLLKIQKRYSFNFDSPTTISLTSRPAIITPSTSIHILNKHYLSSSVTIPHFTTPASVSKNAHFVPIWLQMMIADILVCTPDYNPKSSNTERWASGFEYAVDGISSSQFLFVDYSSFVVGEKPTKSLAVLVESAPGLTVSQDVTSKITDSKTKQTFWLTNAPYSQEIDDILQFSALIRDDPTKILFFDKAKSSRVKQLEIGAVNVTSQFELEALLRYNQFFIDQTTLHVDTNIYDSCVGIAPRCDVRSIEPKLAFGAIGAEIGSYHLTVKNNSYGISGPIDGSYDGPYSGSSSKESEKNLPPVKLSNIKTQFGMEVLGLHDKPTVNAWEMAAVNKEGCLAIIIMNIVFLAISSTAIVIGSFSLSVYLCKRRKARRLQNEIAVPQEKYS
ncbi:putative Phospholipase B [Blattamonas nauphoetae]|uniref:Phospholipase B-like n=1 Tax=Blattamonas nauphoetae TaxID=2049346 RepID=A0ABQ9XE41_9EUKA|nr:putative Phospholipase B [Blattamonas nauphoetae]